MVKQNFGQEVGGKRHRSWKTVVLTAGAALAAMGLALGGFLWGFSVLSKQYSANVVRESTSHMEEIEGQIGNALNISFTDKENALATAASSFDYMGDQTMDSIKPFLSELCKDWGADEVLIYTEYAGESQTGAQENKDDVATAVLKAESGVLSFEVRKSSAEYLQPIVTSTALDGHPIKALSLRFSLDTLLSTNKIASFGDTGSLFLTDKDGRLMSHYPLSQAVDVYNLQTYFSSSTFTDPFGAPLQFAALLASENVSSGMYSFGGGRFYFAMGHLKTVDATFSLLYSVPESAVNGASQTFTSQLNVVGAVVIASFAVVMVFLFSFIYLSRARMMNGQMKARQKLFDQLGSKTANFFSLGRANAYPSYQSPNIIDFIGSSSLVLHFQDGTYSFEIIGENRGFDLAALNASLRNYDGKSDFQSPYIPFLNPQGEKRYGILYLYPQNDAEKSWILILQDMTLDYKKNEALKQALSDANQANVAKTRFLANMSHDIRTPMNAILGMSNFALEEQDPSKTREYLLTINDSATHLLSLINDILDISRIESGKLVLNNAPVDLGRELASSLAVVKNLSEAKKQTFTSAVEMSHHQVLADRTRLGQITINLLNNAVKFTPENGHIDFSFREQPSLKDGFASYEMKVMDNGIGMDQETLAKLFQPFSRASDSQVSQIEGTGLGLAITKNLIETMGGSIDVVSNKGEGSLFTVHLLFEITDAKMESKDEMLPPQRLHFPGLRVLLAEDNKINQQVALLAFKKFDVSCDLANNGLEALQIFSQSSPGYYDAVFLDIQMPVMGGYDAAKEIRRLPRQDAQRVLIAALSANVYAEDMEKSRLAGMDAHLGKPIDLGQLARVLMGIDAKHRSALLKKEGKPYEGSH